MSTITSPRLLTVHEVAEQLRIHEASAYRAIAAGRLPAFRIGSESGPLRVEAEEVAAFLRPVKP